MQFCVEFNERSFVPCYNFKIIYIAFASKTQTHSAESAKFSKNSESRALANLQSLVCTIESGISPICSISHSAARRPLLTAQSATSIINRLMLSVNGPEEPHASVWKIV